MGSPVSASVTVPARVPVSPTGAASTSARASRRPSPKTLLFAAVPPQAVASTSIAVPSSRARVPSMSPTSAGEADQSSATAPAMWGEAIEVPLKAP